MEFHQLIYFLTAAQTQNFRKAAEICLVAQSALSRQIAALEDELDVELFARKKKRVTLTPAGQEFAIYVKDALEQLQQGQQVMNKLQSGHRGTILLGCVESLAAAFVPRAFSLFHQQYPHVRLKVKVDHTDELISCVERGEVDFGLILDPMIRSELLIIKELFRQRLHALVPAHHPLAQKGAEPVTLEQILDEPLLLLEETSRLGQITQRIFAQRGISTRPLVEIESVEGLKEFVRQGAGVTLILPALIRTPHMDTHLALLPIVDLTDEFLFTLVYRRSGTISQAARAFINILMQKESQT